VDSKNIESRPRFEVDTELPVEHQVTYSDYTHSGYDRGHLAPDADFDYEIWDLMKVYKMSNIVPQDPNVNRYQWVKAEDEERNLARKYGTVNVINIVVFDENPEKIKGKVAIPKGFYKVLWNTDVRECFYYDNFILGDMDQDTLEKHRVSCSEAL